ncbi:MAG TPA: DinB family protein [Roseiflexaceae bacterium]|nr:DinB family protein [Roseiflexaceae bacterium]HMP43236.1 DinB family protein [Roseiflexaceae bacterium]
MSRRSVLIDALAATPRDLERLLRPVPEARFLLRPGGEEWCIADVVAHLADIEQRFLVQLQRIVAEANPQIEGLPPHPQQHDLTRPAADLAAEFAVRRTVTLEFLRGLQQADWARPFVSASGHALRFRDRIQLLVGHDSSHLNQIIALREQLERNQ